MGELCGTVLDLNKVIKNFFLKSKKKWGKSFPILGIKTKFLQHYSGYSPSWKLNKQPSVEN